MNKGLTTKEQYYFNVMKSGNVLYLSGRTGTAKSSITRAIAEKTGYQYIDIRLNTADETDFAIPHVVSIDDQPVTKLSIAEWITLANSKPTIIHFEELNRCRQEIQDAALGILLERVIGNSSVKISNDVLLCSSGNLGEEDGTEVKDFDSSLRNRLVMVNHDISVDYWLENFAEENVHSMICSFIRSCPEYFYRTEENGKGQFATPRSWTMLNAYIKSTYGENAPVRNWKEDISQNGSDFVGSSILRLVRYIEEVEVFNISDVVNNYSKVKKIVAQSGRSKLEELLQNLREYKIKELKKEQIQNIISFLTDNKDNQDSVASYLSYVCDSVSIEDMEQSKNVKMFMKELQEYSKVLSNALSIDNELDNE